MFSKSVRTSLVVSAACALWREVEGGRSCLCAKLHKRNLPDAVLLGSTPKRGHPHLRQGLPSERLRKFEAG